MKSHRFSFVEFGRSSFTTVLSLLPMRIGMRFLSGVSVIMGGNSRFKRIAPGVYRVSEMHESLYFSQPSRGSLYLEGIEKRLNELGLQYKVEQIPLGPGNLVVDVGANIGEFARYAERRGARVIAIEMLPHEAAICERNIKGKVHVAALWEAQVEVQLFDDSAHASSSLIRNSAINKGTSVVGQTLDELLAPNFEHGNEPSIWLMKMDVEGAEPEVLRGAERVLAQTRFLTVDVGPERGLECESTRESVRLFMNQVGFTEIWFPDRMGRQVSLFENDNFNS